MTARNRILVTGGTGVIGAYVVRHLFERGATPVVFTRGQTDDIGGAINHDIVQDLAVARGDILNRGSVEHALYDHDVDAIVHMASAKPWQIETPFVPESDPRAAIEQIGIGTLNVLDAARSTGVRRVVYASSKAVFGAITGVYGPPHYQPLPADYPRNPYFLYGVGKVLAEHLGEYYAQQYGTEFVAIRFGASYGPLKRGSVRSFEGLLDAAERGEPVRVRPMLDGQRDDYVYNRDVAAGFALTALAAGPLQRAYNLGSGHTSDHREVLQALRDVFPRADIELEPEQLVREAGPGPTDQARCLMDNGPLEGDVGYQPRFADLRLAFRDYLAELRRIRAQR